MSLKHAAEELQKVADSIEAQAAEATQFVCPKCNHTATLASINASRKKYASEIGENVTVSDITVNDHITCPAPSCDGVLAYKETEASKPNYYEEKVEAAKTEAAAEPAKVEAKNPDAPHSEKTETPEQEAAESVETQKKEQEKGVHASEKVDYDAIDRYMKG